MVNRLLTFGGAFLTGLLLFTVPTAGQTLTAIYDFAGPPDGNSPSGILVEGEGGVLYGTTNSGGTGTCKIDFQPPGCGTVFSLTPPASPGGAWTEKVIYNFAGGSDGAAPWAGVVTGKHGVLYGTTAYSFGTVFSLTPPASPGGSWTLTTLHSFAGGSKDGAIPYGGVLVGKAGVLYGTTYDGGTGGQGTAYKLTPPKTSGGSWEIKLLHSFVNGKDGAGPYSSLAMDSAGALYGTTAHGGTSSMGTVFSLTPPATAGRRWTEAVLHSFTGSSDGCYPLAGVAVGSGGVLFGTTTSVGCSHPSYGTAFAMTPPASPGGAWTENVLYNFAGKPTDGGNPFGGVAIGAGGVLYGTTTYGGASGFGNAGSVFQLTPPASPGGAWTESLLYSFDSTGTGSDGVAPYAGVLIGSGGVLYGTTYTGGTAACPGSSEGSGCGTVFSLTPVGAHPGQ
jgi:uncharacterized repeat protein (TIGR03803 family)